MLNEFKMNDYNGVERDVFLKFGRYNNGRLAIEIISSKDYTPYARATVNVPEIGVLLDNQIIIKNYSENKDMIDFFVDNNLVEEDYGNFYIAHGSECCIATMTKEFMILVEDELE